MTRSSAPASLRDRLSTWARDELTPQHLVASLNAAVLLCLLDLIVLLSLAALIFQGRLAVQLPYAIGAFLLGTALLVLTVALLSSYRGSIAAVQDAPAVILAVAVSSLAAGLPAGASGLFPTVALLIAGATLTLGVMYLVIGAFKLGGLVRFVPYPVVGGFLAATGWLLTLGGIGVATGPAAAGGLLQLAALARWLPALLLGVVLMLALRRWTSPLAPATLLLAAGAVFYAVMVLRGSAPSTLSAEGWLLPPFPHDAAWRWPVSPRSLGQINWQVVLSVIPIAAPAILISLLGVLLNASGLELVTGQDLDLNHELIAAGTANLFAGLAGGLIGYHSISLTALNHTLSNGKRLPGVLAAVLLVLVAVGGTALLAFIPRVLLGGLLMYVGLELLYEWVVKAWFSFPRLEFGVVVAILIIVARWSFLGGIGVGLVAAVLLFVVRYSRVSVVRYEVSGTAFRSRVSRGMRQVELLEAHGDKLLIYRLQGYIFFGTAHTLFERVRARIRRAATPVRFVLLDFEHVTGLDSTGLLSFKKLLQFARANSSELIMTGLTRRVRDQLLADGFSDRTAGLRLLPDLDRGVERCEDRIIAELGTEDPSQATLEALLPAGPLDRATIATLIRSLRRRDVAAGERIIGQGDPPDDLFFLESGQLTAQLEQDGREAVRLETLQGGRMVGEVGFFLGTRRSASVVADHPSVVYVLTRAEWAALGRDDPRRALQLSGLVVYLLGQRVAHLTRVVDALQN